MPPTQRSTLPDDDEDNDDNDDEKRDIEKIYKHTNFNLNGTVIIKKESNIHTIRSGDGENFHIFIDLNKRQRKDSCFGAWSGDGIKKSNRTMKVSFEAFSMLLVFWLIA